MTTLCATLVLNAPAWPRLLMAAAGAALAWELAVYLRMVLSRHSPGGALVTALAGLLAGPLVAGAALLYGIKNLLPGQPLRGKGLMLSSLWGSGLMLLGALTIHGGPAGAVVTLSAAAVAWAVRSYGRTTAPISPGWKRLLLGLRVALVVLLGLWAMGLTFEHRHDKSVPPVVLLGLDTSASMQIRDMPGEADKDGQRQTISRLDAAKRALQDCRPRLKELSQESDLEVFSFAAAPSQPQSYESAPDPWDLWKAAAPATAIGDAAAAAFDPFAGGQDVAAVVLISDGCNNTSRVISPEKFAALMASRGIAVSTVGAGSENISASTRSLNVKELSAADEVEAFNRLPVSAAVEVIGLEGKTVTVTCRFGADLIATQTARITNRYTLLPLKVLHTPLSSGFHRLSVTAEVAGGAPAGLAGEPTAARLVHVVDRELRVLYVEGAFRYEAKYLTQALAAAKRFSIDRRIIIAPAGEESRAFSDDIEDWMGYHVILLGDVSPRHFTRKQLEIMRRLVAEYGKGLAMLGGEQSLSRDWAGTPLADVLPVELVQAQPLPAPVKVVPTPQGLQHEMMKIGADNQDAAALWAQLPPLPGANALGAVKPAAAVLAATDKGQPLIVAQQYGKGRSLAIAFDSTWKWVVNPKDTADLQRRFWRQVALFLAAPKGNVWIVTDKVSYDMQRLGSGSEVIEITAGLEDAAGRAMTDLPVQVALTGPDNASSAIQLRAEGILRRGQIPPPRSPGVYTLKIAADLAGKPLQAEYKFEVLQRDLEAMDVLANHDLLRRMAQVSGGKFVTVDGLAGLLGDLHATAKPRVVETVDQDDLSKVLAWPMLAALLALLCAEWAIRKRRGLV